MKMSNLSVLFCFIIVVFGVAVNGLASKEEVGIYELQKDEFTVKFTNWGASIVSLILPDKEGLSTFAHYHSHRFSFCHGFLNSFCFLFCFCFSGELGDVVLGYDSVKTYMVRFLCLYNIFLFIG